MLQTPNKQKTCLLKYISVCLMMSFFALETWSQNKPILSIELPTDVRTATILHSGKEFLAGTSSLEHGIYRIDAQTGEITRQYKQTSDLCNIAITQDDKLAMSGTMSHSAFVFDLESGETINAFWTYGNGPTEPSFPAKAVCFSPDEKYAVTADYHGKLRRWDLETGKLVQEVVFPHNDPTYVTYLPNGYEVMTTTYYPYIWNLKTNEVRQYPEIESWYPPSLVGNKLLFYLGKTMQLWDTESWALLKEYDSSEYTTKSVALSPVGDNILVGGAIGSTTNKGYDRRIIKTDTGVLARTYQVRSGASLGSPESEDRVVRFFPDGKKFLTVNGNTVHIWDIKDLTSAVHGSEAIKP